VWSLPAFSLLAGHAWFFPSVALSVVVTISKSYLLQEVKGYRWVQPGVRTAQTVQAGRAMLIALAAPLLVAGARSLLGLAGLSFVAAAADVTTVVGVFLAEMRVDRALVAGFTPLLATTAARA